MSFNIKNFGDADKKLVATLERKKAFDASFAKPVDMRRVNADVMTQWVTERITELLGFEDEVVVGLVANMLAQRTDAYSGQVTKLDPKRLQVQLTGFLEQRAGAFVAELWHLLLDAQDAPHGIPRVFVERKKRQLAAGKAAKREPAVETTAPRSGFFGHGGEGSSTSGGRRGDDDRAVVVREGKASELEARQRRVVEAAGGEPPRRRDASPSSRRKRRTTRDDSDDDDDDRRSSRRRRSSFGAPQRSGGGDDDDDAARRGETPRDSERVEKTRKVEDDSFDEFRRRRAVEYDDRTRAAHVPRASSFSGHAALGDASTKIVVRHILLKHAESRRPSSWREQRIATPKADARRELVDIARTVAAAPDRVEALAGIAKTRSDCPSGPQKGGLLKPFKRGDLDKAFEAAAFALAPNELSGVVDAPSGLHVILRIE